MAPRSKELRKTDKDKLKKQKQKTNKKTTGRVHYQTKLLHTYPPKRYAIVSTLDCCDMIHGPDSGSFEMECQ